jgi:hypothetical protein
MNYKLCSRCKFRVPAQLKLCQVCGNRKWLSIDELSATSVSAGSPAHLKAKPGQFFKLSGYAWQPASKAEVVQEPRRVSHQLQNYHGYEAVTKAVQESLDLDLCLADHRRVLDEEVLVRKERIAELSQWFRNYGNEGLLSNEG